MRATIKKASESVQKPKLDIKEWVGTRKYKDKTIKETYKISFKIEWPAEKPKGKSKKVPQYEPHMREIHLRIEKLVTPKNIKVED